MNWKTLDNDKIRHVWKEQTDGSEHTFSPDWYQSNGTPVGSDDRDMIYVRTEVAATAKNQEADPIWKEIDPAKVRIIWDDEMTNTTENRTLEQTQFIRPCGPTGNAMDITRIEIAAETEDELVVPLQEHSFGNAKKKNRNATISISKTGIRIHLGEKDNDSKPDIYLEATTQGWKAFAHANSDEEPFAVIKLEDSGAHEVSVHRENIP